MVEAPASTNWPPSREQALKGGRRGGEEINGKKRVRERSRIGTKPMATKVRYGGIKEKSQSGGTVGGEIEP